MPNLERTILSITEPTIILDTLQVVDEGSGGPGGIDMAKALGDNIPLIKINDYYFPDTEIIDFRIETVEFLPRCRVTVLISDGIFISKCFPKDGDLINIFLKSNIGEFKPVRTDFEIVNVSMTPSTDESGEVSFISFDGVLRIPGIYGEICKAFSNSTSFDALMDVSGDLEIGYASNETNTNDIMNWICGFDTYTKFISDTTNYSYKDDESFFTSFVDWYYYLNFVNVNKQFSNDEQLDDGIIQSLLHDESIDGSASTPSKTNKLFLTNFSKIRGSNFFITNYSLTNKSGSISMENGYRRHIQFYDVNAKKYESQFLDTLNTKGSDSKIILKGRPNENTWQKRVKYKWLGNQYSRPQHNVHENFFFSEIQNYQNNIEIEKLVLNIQLAKANWNLYRYQRIPVVIMNEGNKNRVKNTEGSEENNQVSSLTYDKFLSGFYVILGMTYSYNHLNGWNQEIKLSKREWDPQ